MRLARTPFKGADTTVDIRGEEYACASGRYWVPPREERGGRITTRGKELDRAPSRLLYTHIGWVKREDTGKYAALYKRRIAPIVVLIAVVVCACIGISAAVVRNGGAGNDSAGGTASASAPSYIESETTVPHKSEVTGTAVSYAAYESVPDQTWKANSLTQNIRLALPGSVIEADGSTVGNPVDAAPHIYVDVNGDGAFSEDECVYNPMTYGADGNITDYGKFLRAGTEVNQITLNQALKAGTYNAELVWTGVLVSDHTPANPMSFNFVITVS